MPRQAGRAVRSVDLVCLVDVCPPLRRPVTDVCGAAAHGGARAAGGGGGRGAVGRHGHPAAHVRAAEAGAAAGAHRVALPRQAAAPRLPPRRRQGRRAG